MKEMLPQPKFRYTNETVGLFVLITLMLFVAGLIYSGQIRKWFNPGETLKVVLPDEGLFGLAKGSAVEILGTKAGEVRDIVINPDQKIHADVRIDRDMAVFVRSDSKAFMASAWSGSSPFMALRRIIPGISSRLISLVPSQIRLIRASR